MRGPPREKGGPEKVKSRGRVQNRVAATRRNRTGLTDKAVFGNGKRSAAPLDPEKSIRQWNEFGRVKVPPRRWDSRGRPKRRANA